MSEPRTAAASEEPQPKPHVDTAANVEMTDLQSNSAYATPAEEHPPSLTPADAAPQPPSQPQDHLSPGSTSPSAAAVSHDTTTTTDEKADPSQQQTTAASSVSGVEPIGPSTTATTIGSEPAATGGPSIHIILLLTTGSRHSYKIDPRYLRKRNVDAENGDPFNISVYTLKELIWREWRKDDWEPRPSSPAYIRLINMGRMLDDKSALKDCRFNHESPNIVHMTVKPQEIIDEEDNAKSKGGRDRDGEEATAGCRCVIL